MQVYSFSQTGKRNNNEDYYGKNQNIFVVCDGVGGHTSGEFASRFVVENLLKETSAEGFEFSKISIQQCLIKIQEDLNVVLDENPELEKMGTTFTGIFRTSDAWFAAHIGDSRIYLIRPDEQKVWHTWDHSLVGELVRTNTITREAGRFHPMGNRISKAISANVENKTTRADIIKIDYLKQGDIFLLCTDGVGEAWADHELVSLLCSNEIKPEQKIDIISQQCESLSKDNNTAIMLVIENEDELLQGSNEEITWISHKEIMNDYQKYVNENENEGIESDSFGSKIITPEPVNTNKQKPQTHKPQKEVGSNRKSSSDKLFKLIIIFFLTVLTLFAAYYIYNKYKSDPKSNDIRTPSQNAAAHATKSSLPNVASTKASGSLAEEDESYTEDEETKEDTHRDEPVGGI
ncbi:MAG: protein phosphatase 2C domain-containing protein [Bacteroidales bacterium]|nr:protein phosphatase 2C domain-containing protein [Bacteroidales bacterium]